MLNRHLLGNLKAHNLQLSQEPEAQYALAANELYAAEHVHAVEYVAKRNLADFVAANDEDTWPHDERAFNAQQQRLKHEAELGVRAVKLTLPLDDIRDLNRWALQAGLSTEEMVRSCLADPLADNRETQQP